MKIRLPIELCVRCIEATGSEDLKAAKERSPLKRYVDIDGLRIDKKALKWLYKETKDQETQTSDSIAFLYKSLTSTEEVYVNSIEQLAIALPTVLKQSHISGYVFARGSYNSVLPYLVKQVEYQSDDHEQGYGRYGKYRTRTVVLELAYSVTSSTDPKVLNRIISAHTLEDLFIQYKIEYKEITRKPPGKDEVPKLIDVVAVGRGLPISEIFKYLEIFLETKDLHELYGKQLERFVKYIPMYGKQFRVRGTATRSSSWWSESLSLLTDGKPARCVMDTIPKACVEGATVDEERGRSKRRYHDDEDGDETDNIDLSKLEIPLEHVTVEDVQAKVTLKDNIEKLAPLHPTLQIFHLDQHRFHSVHVNNLALYKYKDNIRDMLILPEEVKELAEMLVAAASEDVEDVIEGKSQSTVVTCIGDPGLGKTLLAEVMSEDCKKPLYKIQAAQLGSSPEIIEKTLEQILRRVERWNAVLMIDEANAYIHARGNDVRQNAVVGVFLRKLEYFKGVLIFTTNQTNPDGTGFDIDDAILSRSAACVYFELPSKELAVDHWKLQAKLMGVDDLTDDLIAKLVAKFSISGRSIRHLLKLTSRWAKKKEEKLQYKHFITCSKYIPTTRREELDKEGAKK